MILNEIPIMDSVVQSAGKIDISTNDIPLE